MIRLSKAHVEVSKFPDGTFKININSYPFGKNDVAQIFWDYEKEEEFVIVQYISMWIDEHFGCEKSLVMKYVPNARFDRVKDFTEVFTLKYFCKMINLLNFKNVYVVDAHSNVCLGLLDNVVNISPEKYIRKFLQLIEFDEEKDALFFPDEGSAKRYSEIMKLPYICGSKNRDWKTGKILGLNLSVPDFGFVPRKVAIIDDICSKGGTYFYSAKEYKKINPNAEIYLYVTHCENTILDGELINSGLVKRVYTTETIFTKENDFVYVMKGI